MFHQMSDRAFATSGTPGGMTVANYLRQGNPANPTFCLGHEAARLAVSRFIDGFAGRISFAVKACPVPAYLSVLRNAGIGHFDVASPAEMALVHEINPDAVLHYHNPIRSPTETRDAYRNFGCRRFAVDDEAGLDALMANVPPDAKLEIAVRIGVSGSQALHDFSGKFGADDETARRLLARIACADMLPVVTFHPGSQCLDPQAYSKLIEISARLAGEAGVKLHTLNVGGGFPVDYGTPSPPPLAAFFDVINRTFRQCFETRHTVLECEPGRALAADALSVLVEVKHRRKDGSLFVSDGIYGALMEMVQIPISFPTTVWRGGRFLLGETRPAIVYGPTCDPIDRLPRRLDLPMDIAVGDMIEFHLVGGYGPATITRFNGYGRYGLVELA